MKDRPYYRTFWEELQAEKAMVFMSGPRQAGKTTLAKSFGASAGGSVYFNYDVPADKVRLAENPVFFEETDRLPGQPPLVILDEIHKYKDWKNYLKGIYDGYAGAFRFLITGSGRLDLLSNAGDALAGRFLRFRVYPFTLGEIYGHQPRERAEFAELFDDVEVRPAEPEATLETMLNCSGFPEPFLKGRETSYRRWANVYHRQIVRDDVRDVLAVQNLAGIETLYALMADRVGSPLSIASLTGPLKVSHKTISSWLEVFERLFLMFKIRPYSRKINRSLLREPKYYHFDWCRSRSVGARFENLVAVELLRAVMSWNDYGLGNFDLFYLRTKDGIEVDFLVTQDGEPLFMLEVKNSDPQVSPGLLKMQDQLQVPAIQLVRRPGTNRRIRNGDQQIRIVNAAHWLAQLR